MLVSALIFAGSLSVPCLVSYLIFIESYFSFSFLRSFSSLAISELEMWRPSLVMRGGAAVSTISDLNFNNLKQSASLKPLSL
jgi:hypothetical protein